MIDKKMNVPLLNLEGQYKQIKEGVKKEIEEVLDSQSYILGPKVKLFEDNVAKYCGSKYAVGVSSGTDALLISLITLNVNKGDEVILPSFTFFATAGVVHRVGAKIVFADIDPVTFNLSPESFKKTITRKTKVVIPVHLFGQCVDMDEITKIAKENNIKIIEDSAQSVGSEYKTKRAGSLGDLGAFSCYPSKNLGAFGEAGFITTSDDKLYDKLIIGRNHGQGNRTYYHRFVGGNFRMDGIQGAVLNYKLKYLDEWTEKRKENANFLTEQFITHKLVNEHIILPEIVFERHIFNQYTIRVKNGKRDGLRKYLQEKGIGTGVYYPLPLHLQPCFEYLGHKKGDFPESEKASEEVLSLPIYPELTEEMKHYVVDNIVKFFS